LFVNTNIYTPTLLVNDKATVHNLDINGTILKNGIPLIPPGTMKLVARNFWDENYNGEWSWCNGGYAKNDGYGRINWSWDQFEGSTHLPSIGCISQGDTELCYMIKL